MKSIALLLAFMLTLTTGCTPAKNADVETFITAHGAVITDIVKIVTDDPSVQGVEKAQRYFEGKRADLRAKEEKFNKVSASDVPEAQMKQFLDQLWKDNDKLFGPLTDLKSQPTWTEDAIGKYNRLIADVRNRVPGDGGGK